MPYRPQGTWVILLSFLAALILSAFPLPDVVLWWWPQWVVLVLLYWIVALPQRVGIGTAWILGILLDLLEGSLLGLNALALTLIAYIALLSYHRVRMFSWLQQALFVFLLVALNQVVEHLTKGILGFTVQNYMFLVPALVSALLWPWLFVILRGLRRAFNVS